MNSMVTALKFDSEDIPVDAVAAYEEELRTNPENWDAIVNLLALYLAVLETGYSSSHQLSQDYIEHGDARFNAILKLGMKQYPDDMELDFWRRYYQVTVLGNNWDEAFPQKYEEAVCSGKHLVPYLALYLSASGKKYEDEVRCLFKEMSEGRTQRERDLRALAESSLKQLGGSRT